ncbi:Hypothetical protein SCF082_LOCUS24685 [Durusdinium trenchii]
MEDTVAAAVLTHAQLLAQQPPKSRCSTLLVAPQCHALEDFEVYLELCAWLEEAFTELNLNGQVQMATFHPQFRFGDSVGSDAADFVNRAPWAAFHLLREEEVSAALASFRVPGTATFDDPEAVGEFISDRNARFLRARGYQKCLQDLR